MKKASLFLLVAFTLSGCQDDANPISFGTPDSFSINATIKEYQGGYTIVKGYTRPKSDSVAFIHSEIDSNGKFRLYVPSPPDHLLSPYIPWDTIITYEGGGEVSFIDNVTIHDSSLRYSRLALYAEDTIPPVIGFELDQGSLTTRYNWAKPGDYYLSYCYFTAKTLIDGDFTYRVVSPDTSRETRTRLNIQADVGWNLIMTRYAGDSANTSNYEMVDLDSEQGEWLIGASGLFRIIRRF